MVSKFRRSLSLPKPTKPTPPPEKSYHVRSASLPCRSHPLISQLRDNLEVLRAWQSEPSPRSSSWLCAGLQRLQLLHDSLDDLLQLPQSQESLRRLSGYVEKLLDHFLQFVDVYGIFRAALVALKEEQLAAQVNIRSRRDKSKISSYIKARRNMNKEMLKLVSVVRNIGKDCVSVRVSLSFTDSDWELVEILREVNALTVAVSVSAFGGMALSGVTRSWMGLKLSKNKREDGIREFEEADVEDLRRLKRKDEEEETARIALRKLEVLEDCIGRIERVCERVFRSLIGTRVSLLNILTQ